eukprot:1158826-Pelagomonas_calceolata.AAC.7
MFSSAWKAGVVDVATGDVYALKHLRLGAEQDLLKEVQQEVLILNMNSEPWKRELAPQRIPGAPRLPFRFSEASAEGFASAS